MARANKQAALTLEERLQQALILDWEQPYKVPENWVWTRIGQVTTIVGGGTPSSKVREYYEDGTVPWISPADLSDYDDVYISRGRKMITKLGLEKSSAQMVPAKTVCLSSRAPIGYVVIAKNDLCTNQGFKSFLPSPIYLPEYLYWYLKSNKELLESYASGTTFLELSGGKASQIAFPIAPLAEQQRIVDRIDSLFAKLDEAKEKVQAVLGSFEARKAAILHKAFTGELTAKWRKEHGVGIGNWKRYKLIEVCKKITDGTHHSPLNNLEGDYMYITAKNVKEGGIDLSNITYVSKDVHDEIYARCNVEKGDVLYIKDGATTGVAVVNNIERPFSMLSSVALLKPNTACVLAKYLVYNLNSSETKSMMISNMSGNAITRLTIAKIQNSEVNVPEIAEQQEIVRVLDDLFAKEQQAKNTCADMLDQIDLIKKSVLARVFRGEMRTNDPNEESVVELLKQHLAQQANEQE